MNAALMRGLSLLLTVWLAGALALMALEVSSVALSLAWLGMVIHAMVARPQA